MTGSTARSSLCLLLLGAMALVSPTPAAPEELGAAAVLQQVQDWLDETRDLEARFEQQLLSGAFGAGDVESGRLWIRRPGRMRWEYQQPESKLALIEGDLTWLYLPEEGQLMLGRLDRESELLPTLLAGDGRLSRLFLVDLAATPREGGRGAYRLRLLPHREADAFEEVVVTARPPQFAIESAEVVDAAGNRVIYRFGKLRRNRGVDASLFRIETAPETEVIGTHESPGTAP